MNKIAITIEGDAADAVETLKRITAQADTADVIYSALRLYEWILARQTKGSPVLSPPVPHEARKKKNQQLPNYIKDKDEALSYFKGRDIYEH